MDLPLEIEYWPIGDTLVIKHTEIKDADDALVTDFTGWKFHATLKAALSDDDASATKKINTSSFTVTDASSKAIGYMETESVRGTITLGNDYYLDAQIIDASGNVATVIRRLINFYQDTSKRTTDT